MSLEECKEEREANESYETQEQWNEFVRSFERLLLSQARKWRRNTIQAANVQVSNQAPPIIKDEEAQTTASTCTERTVA